jgi:hypothetical protein
MGSNHRRLSRRFTDPSALSYLPPRSRPLTSTSAFQRVGSGSLPCFSRSACPRFRVPRGARTRTRTAPPRTGPAGVVILTARPQVCLTSAKNACRRFRSADIGRITRRGSAQIIHSVRPIDHGLHRYQSVSNWRILSLHQYPAQTEIANSVSCCGMLLLHHAATRTAGPCPAVWTIGKPQSCPFIHHTLSLYP